MLEDMINTSFKDTIRQILSDFKYVHPNTKTYPIDDLKKHPSIYLWFEDWLKHESELVRISLMERI